MISIHEYIELWDKVYVWSEGERDLFIDGLKKYANDKGVNFDDLYLEKDKQN